jgi:hypothetical protein
MSAGVDAEFGAGLSNISSPPAFSTYVDALERRTMSTYMKEVDYFAGRAQYCLRRANEDSDNVLRRGSRGHGEGLFRQGDRRRPEPDASRGRWRGAGVLTRRRRSVLSPLARKHSQLRTLPRMDRDQRHGTPAAESAQPPRRLRETRFTTALRRASSPGVTFVDGPPTGASGSQQHARWTVAVARARARAALAQADRTVLAQAASRCTRRARAR